MIILQFILVSVHNHMQTKNGEKGLEVFSEPRREWLYSFFLGLYVRTYPLREISSQFSQRTEMVPFTVGFLLRKMRPLMTGT